VVFKISKDEQKTIDEVIATFTEKKDELAEAVIAHNEAVNAARAKLDDVLTEVNEARDAIYGAIEGIKDEKQNEFDDKSERWQEGDRGQATTTWIESIEAFRDLFEDEIEVDAVEDLEIDLSDLESALEEGLSSEPDY
jgi:hypothetical protein